MFHRDLIDMSEGAGSGCTLYGFKGDILHLLFGLLEGPLQGIDLFGLALDRLFEGLDLEFRHFPFGLRVFLEDQNLLFILGRRLPCCFFQSRFFFRGYAGWQACNLKPQAGQLVFPLF